jgi:hypothetical protein
MLGLDRCAIAVVSNVPSNAVRSECRSHLSKKAIEDNYDENIFYCTVAVGLRLVEFESDDDLTKSDRLAHSISCRCTATQLLGRHYCMSSNVIICHRRSPLLDETKQKNRI